MKKSFYKKILDRIFVLRIFMHYPFAAILLLGFFYSLKLNNFFSDKSLIESFLILNKFNLQLFVSFFLFYFMMGGTYILNQIVDKESDRINRKNFFISDNHISVRSSIIQLCFIYILSLIISFYLSINGFMRGGIFYFYTILFSIIIGIMYSLPPFRLNAKPGLDMLANAIGYGLLNFSAGYLAVSGFSVEIIKISVILLFIGLAGFGSTTIADIPGDKADNKKTIGVLLGEKNTYIISILLFVLSGILSIYFKYYLLLVPSLIPIPFQIWGLIKKGKQAALITMRISNAPLVIISFILFPFYLFGFFVVFYITKIFYKKRFDISYPSFRK